jgi:hypothetical protein
MSDFIDLGFGQNDESIGQKSTKFKLKEGESYRLSFAWWPGSESSQPDLNAPSPKFIGAKRLYMNGVGYFLDKGPEYTKIAGQASKMVIATIVAVWPTDQRGGLDKERFARGDVRVMPWIFSQDKYKMFQQNHSEFPLGQHDLTVSCTDTQYQKITVSPCRESLFRKLLDANNREKAPLSSILAGVQQIAANLQAEIARDMTLDQIRTALGQGGAAPTARAAGGTTADIDDLLSVLDG